MSQLSKYKYIYTFMRCCLLNNRPMSNCFKHLSQHKQIVVFCSENSAMARCQDIHIHQNILKRDSWLRKTDQNFCFIEVREMVVAVRQPSSECTAIFTMCIVLHRPSPCAVTIHKTRTDQRWNWQYQNRANGWGSHKYCPATIPRIFTPRDINNISMHTYF